MNRLCPHGRLTTAFCYPCSMAEYLRDKFMGDEHCGITPTILIDKCKHDVRIDEDCEECMPSDMRASEYQVAGNHYKSMAIQPHYFCHKNRLGALESNLVKYACRHHQKGGREDVEKIIHYAQLLLEWEYGVSDEKDS